MSVLTRRFPAGENQVSGFLQCRQIHDYLVIHLPTAEKRVSNNGHNTLHLARQHKGTSVLHPTAFAVHPDFAYPLVANLRCLLLLTTGRMDVAPSGDYYNASEPNRDTSRQVTASIRQNSSCNTAADRCRAGCNQSQTRNIDSVSRPSGSGHDSLLRRAICAG